MASALPQERTRQAGQGRLSPTAYLRAVDIFRGLNPEDIERIHQIAPMRQCDRGMVFYGPGAPGEQLFLLKEGKVTLYRLTPDGRKLAVRMVEAGMVFGEMAIAGQTMQECFAEADEDSLVCTITLTQMERILQQHPSVARQLLAVLGRRVRDLEDRLEQMAYGNVRERLARFLLAQARPAHDGCQVTGFSHEQIAEAVGASRQTVSIELGALEAEGLVEVGRRRVRLVQAMGLRSLAGLLDQPGPAKRTDAARQVTLRREPRLGSSNAIS
ncbi:MAG: Crp/Fnr family transcriptional regulator [Chloroflexi bacterium]|nr:Crp/Fnr family transcriptional regulator [Chloroflexota bacterium]